MKCSFCGKAEATGFSRSRKVGCCPSCATGEAAEMVDAAARAGGGALPMIVGGGGKMDRLTREARGPAALSLVPTVTRPPAPRTQLQVEAGKARRRAKDQGRPLNATELSVSLAATAEMNRRPLVRTAGAQDSIRAMVKKSGLRTA